MLTRPTLLKKLKSKYDQDAWDEFYSNYSRYVGAVLKSLHVNVDDIDDLVQKVMVICWEKIPEFEYDKSGGLFRSWLVRITKNVVMNYFSSSQRTSRKNKAFSEHQLSMSDDQVDSNAEKEWRIHISKLAWENIKDNYQENAQQVYELVTKGMKNKEIAETLDLTANAVGVFKNRITDAMKAEIIHLNHFLS